MNDTPYIHDEDVHNVTDARVISSILYSELGPQSVIDIGCGIGTFLRAFKDLGVKEVLGLDGAWADQTLLNKYLSDQEFLAYDLETHFDAGRRFDLAISLKVGEHLRKDAAEDFVRSLVSASDVIVFSAAIPGQVGQHHVNEQWPDYWAQLFSKHGYTFHDVLRPIFWHNDRLPRWYKQNMFLVLREGHEEIATRFEKHKVDQVMCCAHPDYYSPMLLENEKLKRAQNKTRTKYTALRDAHESPLTYLKLLMKSIARKSRLLRS